MSNRTTVEILDIREVDSGLPCTLPPTLRQGFALGGARRAAKKAVAVHAALQEARAWLEDVVEDRGDPDASGREALQCLNSARLRAEALLSETRALLRRIDKVEKQAKDTIIVARVED